MNGWPLAVTLLAALFTGVFLERVRRALLPTPSEDADDEAALEARIDRYMRLREKCAHGTQPHFGCDKCAAAAARGEGK